MQHVIRYTLPDKSRVYYSVERGDFGAREEATVFKRTRDVKMVRLGLHEEKALSLLKLEVVPV